MRSTCPLCETLLPAPFVDRRGVPVQQHALLATPEAARAFPRGDLTLSHCTTCDFVTNFAFDARLLDYGSAYENLQLHSPFFEEYVDGLVEHLVERGVTGKTVVEVGCGSGYFLVKLCEGGLNEGVGFDTAYRGPDTVGSARFVRDHYGPEYAEIPADLVVTRHTIEHVGEPLALLGAIREALDDSSAPLVVVETPAVEWILEGCVTQDFFYEHASYFSEVSLAFALERAGFEGVEIRRTFGGQYLWAEATPARAHVGPPSPPDGHRLDGAITAYREREAALIAATRSGLESLAERGGVALWGAGAKGVTFANLMDPDVDVVACVVDINPRKQGMFVAGTGHPIVPIEGLEERDVVSVVLMNPNYLDETRRMVDEAGLAVDVVTEEHLIRTP